MMGQQKTKNTTVSKNKRHVKKIVSLKSKNNLEIVTYNFESDVTEDFNEQLKKLNAELEKMLEQYYSSNVVVERIQRRDLMYIVKTFVYKHKKKNKEKL